MELQSGSYYKIIYTDSSSVVFQVVGEVPLAKHLICVKVEGSDEITDYIRLLQKPWRDLVELKKADVPEQVLS